MPFCEIKNTAQVILIISQAECCPSRPTASSGAQNLSDEMWDLCNCCWSRDSRKRPTIVKIVAEVQRLQRTQSVADFIGSLHPVSPFGQEYAESPRLLGHPRPPDIITTTFHPPPLFDEDYFSGLMNKHQRSQGFSISLQTPYQRLSPRSDGSSPKGTTELRTVAVPRRTLFDFLSITARVTAQNKETCGLLLGKLNGRKFVVETLLIPRQHTTSDNLCCTMDEEDLVLEFARQRKMITLGWVRY